MCRDATLRLTGQKRFFRQILGVNGGEYGVHQARLLRPSMLRNSARIPARCRVRHLVRGPRISDCVKASTAPEARI